ncbi:hypothetical protein [Bradyrhizobium elkanii]|uniref:hypothetical protein n=1 Tax=Bradyrhizobium elkanii TaxID=29448 RepID=UPI002715314E|nr:hypothetical protein [Bradyrhizobium elkanii]WLB04198.1 hypothetical protein QNJ80_20315 [Bradyrhizobium elkanii]
MDADHPENGVLIPCRNTKIPAPAWLHGAADLIDVDAASEAMLVVDHTPTPVVPSFPIAPVPATLQAVA